MITMTADVAVKGKGQTSIFIFGLGPRTRKLRRVCVGEEHKNAS